jgi:hypothetical protein
LGEKVPDKTQAEIPYSHLEYTAVFKKPMAWTAPANLISAVLTELEPWGFKLDGVEIKTHMEKLSEHTVIFRRTAPLFPGQSVTLGVGRVVVAAENPDRMEAEQLVAMSRAALNVVCQTGRAEIQSQHLFLGVHIQLKDKPRRDATASLLNPVAFELLDGEVKFPGIILLREKSSIVIDASVGYANGLYVRISREHPPEATLEHLAEVLRKDEEKLFDVLGLEGIL